MTPAHAAPPAAAVPSLQRWNVAFFVVGLAALLLLTMHVGPAQLFGSVRAVGYAFAFSSSLHLCGLLLDGVGLRWCAGTDGPRVSWGRYVWCTIAGHAINESSPLAQMGELTKYTLLSGLLPRERVASALLLQNLMFLLCNSLLIGLCPVAVAYALGVTGPAAVVLQTTSGVFVVISLGLLAMLWVGPRVVTHTVLPRLPLPARFKERFTTFWMAARDSLKDGLAHRARLTGALLCTVGERSLAVLELTVILHFLGVDRALTVAFLALSNVQLVTWLTSWVPLQAGTTEGASYLLFEAVGLVPQAGVSMELVRKARKVCFILFGLTLLGLHAFRKTPPAPPSDGERPTDGTAPG